MKATAHGVVGIGDLCGHDLERGRAEPIEGVGEALASERDVRAVGHVEDRDRSGHASTVNPPLQRRVKVLGRRRWRCRSASLPSGRNNRASGPYPRRSDGPTTGHPPRARIRSESKEAVRLGFVIALQRLPPRQCAAPCLCGSSGTSDGRPVSPSSAAQQTEAEVARRFADAYSADDVDELLGLLTDDAWLAVPPAPHEYHGTDAVARFLRASAAGRARQRLGLVPTRANGQPAFVCFLGDPADPAAQPSGIVVLDVAGERVAGVTRFLEPLLASIFLSHSFSNLRDVRKTAQAVGSS